MRAILGLALLFSLSSSVANPTSGSLILTFTPIPLDRDRPERRNFGPLTLLGAWRLDADSPYFGGVSSMYVDRGAFVALSDSALVFRFRFDSQQHSSPLSIRRLAGIFSADNPSPDRDTESMTRDPVSGNTWIGFETSNAIRRYSSGLAIKETWVAPQKMRHWPINQGPEAMARLADGRFIVISEATPGPGGSREAVLFSRDPTRPNTHGLRFYYRPPGRFSPTDAAQLPDGRLLVLNRHFSIFDGISAVVTVIDPGEIAPDRVVTGKIVARLAPPLNIDNMEALSIEQENGQVIVWIASDDNFNPLQQTLLLKFRFDP